MENTVAELEQTDDLSGMQVSSQPLQMHSEKNERNSSDDPSIRHPFTVMSDGRLSESQQGKLHDHSLTEMKGSEQVQDEQFLSKKTVDVVNVLTLYEEVLKGDTLSTLNHFVNEFRVAGQKGELLGETYGSFNRQTHHKTEFIQFGVPMFEQIKADKTNRFPTRHVEPIPALLQGLIEQVIEHNLIPKNRTPNGCKIFFFDELESSKIFVKPPHVDPIFTVILSESIMTLGDEIQYDGLRDYRGSLRLSLKKGSVLVMKKEATSTMQAICSSPNKRVTINFFKVLSKDE